MKRISRILVVEDDEMIHTIIRFLLEKEGFFVDVATDGNAAIVKMDAGVYDLVLSDLLLPYKSGFEVMRYVKNKYPHVPVIILSVLAREDATIKEAFSLGADDLIAKPFNPIELVCRAKRFL